MNIDVLRPMFDAQLADRLQERQRFDIADGAADFDQRHIKPRVASWMQCLISSVICGITCTVAPR